MIVTCVHVWVKKDHIDDFKKASIENHEKSVKEPGNLRFDFLQHQDDPTRFLLYEAYESEEASKAHKLTDHYLRWKTTVADWMAKPREGVPYNIIEPGDIKAW